MSLERILNKISEDAEAAAGDILAKAKTEAGSIAERYEKEARRLRAGLEELAERRAAEEKRRVLTGEELELRKAALAGKRSLLDEVYNEARLRIEKLPEREYLSLLASLVGSSAISGTEQIVPAAGQRRLLDEKFLKEAAAAFGGLARFSVSAEEGDFRWGAVLMEKKRRIDLTLDPLFRQARERTEPKVAAILFDERGEG